MNTSLKNNITLLILLLMILPFRVDSQFQPHNPGLPPSVTYTPPKNQVQIIELNTKNTIILFKDTLGKVIEYSEPTVIDYLSFLQNTCKIDSSSPHCQYLGGKPNAPVLLYNWENGFRQWMNDELHYFDWFWGYYDSEAPDFSNASGRRDRKYYCPCLTPQWKNREIVSNFLTRPFNYRCDRRDADTLATKAKKIIALAKWDRRTESLMEEGFRKIMQYAEPIQILIEIREGKWIEAKVIPNQTQKEISLLWTERLNTIIKDCQSSLKPIQAGNYKDFNIWITTTLSYLHFEPK